jgi:hypothetical protein
MSARISGRDRATAQHRPADGLHNAGAANLAGHPFGPTVADYAARICGVGEDLRRVSSPWTSGRHRVKVLNDGGSQTQMHGKIVWRYKFDAPESTRENRLIIEKSGFATKKEAQDATAGFFRNTDAATSATISTHCTVDVDPRRCPVTGDRMEPETSGHTTTWPATSGTLAIASSMASWRAFRASSGTAASQFRKGRQQLVREHPRPLDFARIAQSPR